MRRFLPAAALLNALACTPNASLDEPSTTRSGFILSQVHLADACTFSISNPPLRRGVYDLAGVDLNNDQGRTYTAGLWLRDETATEIGSKRIIVSYDFSGNLVPPSPATRHELSQEIMVPIGGHLTPGDKDLIITAPIITEYVTKLLANDPAIRGQLHWDDEVMNHQAGLPAFYQVQVKMQATTLSTEGAWLRSPPFYQVIDLCVGCITRVPNQLRYSAGGFDDVCSPFQDNIGVAAAFPPFADLTSTGEIDTELEAGGVDKLALVALNGGEAITAWPATRRGSSNLGLWLIHPVYKGADAFLFSGIEVAAPNFFAHCDVGPIASGSQRGCLISPYPRRCNDAGQTLCTLDSQCAEGISCATAVDLLIDNGNAGTPVLCGEPDVAGNDIRRCAGDGECTVGEVCSEGACASPCDDDNDCAGSDRCFASVCAKPCDEESPCDEGYGCQPDHCVALPPVDGAGKPKRNCMWVVCADANNEVMEWSPEGANVESQESNCKCFATDQEMLENCPFEQ
jgi:hypothetical protein